MSLRELGNEQYKEGNFKEAEHLYTAAIQQNSSDYKLLSNRALARLKLKDWDGAESDSREAIERTMTTDDYKTHMKSYYYLAQALSQLRRSDEALHMARTSYQMALDTGDRSTEVMSQFILQLKKDLWQDREMKRLRSLNETLGLVEETLEERRQEQLAQVRAAFQSGDLGETGRDEEIAAIETDTKDRITQVREAFADSSKPETQERVIPEYLIDSMTFDIMHDPVITPSGASYERATLIKYLREHPNDPLTREPLSERQLIPNRALREVAEQFLEKNGWAIDY